MFQKKYFSGKKVTKGFTLVEIIVVLVILAILAAATIPSMLGFIDDAKFKAIDNEARVVRNAAQAYATEQSAKGEADTDIQNKINGVINSNHALHNLLQNDANGTVFETKVEKGKIKKFNYTKEIINQDEDVITDKIRYAVFDDTKSSLLHATGIFASINNIENFKADLKADLLQSLAADMEVMRTGLQTDLTSDLTSSLTSNLTSDLTSSIKSSLTSELTSSLSSSLTTDLNSSLETGMNQKIAALKTNFRTELGSNVVDLIYPVGSYYISNNSTSPATLFGGTWTQITDKFLYCANSSGQTGGSSTHTHTTGDHTLTIDEMPSHQHEQVVATADNDGDRSRQIDHNSYGKCKLISQSYAQTLARGGGQAHNHGNTGSASNLPPYMTVYCWRRAA